MSPDTKTVSARITGKVQGVSFRAWTRQQAQSRALSGWVRNEADGSVSAVFSGSARMIDEVIVLLQDGPQAARVEGVEIQAATEPEDIGFGIVG
ncbi:acylphosphatase [Aquisalinus flavus]|uniref:Acylphosphatase n=1 Tax=Aquisalinus flavus TaxID=1526572 RepID=A0A8J2V432_9PROT|nr:acylphosphatase [Aquisalinus flavus]MBD0427211.1 acylphosphatase [Aquisalinus flavus]UNE47026.1 acylphosphatase [Aquisalinus flavus]GGC99204.1 acylphosphatase [Aquisalinus flavus]